MAKVKSVRALERGLQVLECIGEADSLSLNDLYLRTRLSRATLLRALKTLQQSGWIQTAHEGAGYRLGPKMFGTTALRSRHRTLADLAVPVLSELGKKVIWPSDVGICRGASMVILESSRRNSPFIINRNAVGRRPSLLKSAMGRAYLAFCPQQERERLLERLRRSTHPDDKLVAVTPLVQRILQDTRARGYGVREPGYWAGTDDFGADVSSIAVAVMIGEQVAACISLLWVAGTSSVEDFARAHLGALREAAAMLARSIDEQRRRAR
jgi:IclR family transcriptional regulator, mhp operon transcriptional activator